MTIAKPIAAQDYIDAVKSPKLSFIDPYLKQGTPATKQTKTGQERLITNSGSFAMTIKYLVGSEVWAVRCFMQDKLPSDLEERYHEVTKFIINNKTDFLVDIEYQPQGLLVTGNRRPICKMQWIEGIQLNAYLAANKNHPSKLAALPEKFLHIVMGMAQLGCAHGDLQHGNILMSGDDMILIDYDGMYVPAYAGTTHKINESGHPNYQHPLRQSSTNYFNADIDCFSAIAIYLSLCAIRRDKTLIVLNAKNENEAEHLFLRATDYKNPQQSAQIKLLTGLGYTEAADRFSKMCEVELDALPTLRQFLLDCPSLLKELTPDTLAKLQDDGAKWVTPRTSAGIARSALPVAPNPSPILTPSSAIVSSTAKSTAFRPNESSSFALPNNLMQSGSLTSIKKTSLQVGATPPSVSSPSRAYQGSSSQQQKSWRWFAAALLIIVIGAFVYRASTGQSLTSFVPSPTRTPYVVADYSTRTPFPTDTPDYGSTSTETARETTAFENNVAQYVTPAATLTSVSDQSNSANILPSDLSHYAGDIETGPMHGVLTHNNVPTIKIRDSGVSMRDFVASVTFTNGTDSQASDYGLLFRYVTPTNHYKLLCTSQLSWFLTMATNSTKDTTIASGNLGSAWNVGATASNTITLIASGTQGLFYLNGRLIQALDLSSSTQSGEIQVATGMFTDDISPGLEVSYQDFTIYRTSSDIGYYLTTPSTEAAQSTSLPQYLFKGTVISDVRINVRSSPSVNGTVIGGLNPGDSVKVLEISNDRNWYRIDFDSGYNAWVSASLISQN